MYVKSSTCPRPRGQQTRAHGLSLAWWRFVQGVSLGHGHACSLAYCLWPLPHCSDKAEESQSPAKSKIFHYTALNRKGFPNPVLDSRALSEWRLWGQKNRDCYSILQIKEGKLNRVTNRGAKLVSARPGRGPDCLTPSPVFDPLHSTDLFTSLNKQSGLS